MIIKQIKIKNYRQYKGEVIIDLGTSNKKNVDIIIGSTGAGKTNLNNAIQWCFYGTEPSLEKSKGFGIFNMDVFSKSEEGKINQVIVEITLELPNGEVYSIERTQTIEKRNNKQVVIPFDYSEKQKDGSKLKAYYHGRGIHSLDENFPTRLINILAPARISEFFFYDGEKLENYFNDSSGEKIKDSIFKISQLDLLVKIKDRLESVIREYQQESKRLSPASSELCKEIEGLEKLYQEKKEEINTKKKLSNQLKEKRNELLKKFKDYASKDNIRRIERNEQIEKLKEELKEKLEEKKQEKREILFKNASFFISINAIQDALNIFLEARKKKIIPPNINSDFIKKLLNDGICICKTDISKKNQASRKNIETLLNQLSKLGAQAGELIEKERDMIIIKDSKLYLLNKELKTLNNNIVENEKQIETLIKEYEENESKIGDLKIDKNQIINFEEKNEEFNDQIEQIAGNINVLKNKIKELEWELNEKKEALIKENAKAEKGKELNQKIKFCEKAKKYSMQIQEKIMNEIRQEIQKATEGYYRELHWKKNENIDIIIDENYQIVALQKGYDKFGSFSAGEKALLATSFLIALNNVSGFKVPIIMDTALGRIDYGPRENFAKNIATYLKDNQIILLFTEAEYSSGVEKNLLPHINHLYRIDVLSEWTVKINKEKIK